MEPRGVLPHLTQYFLKLKPFAFNFWARCVSVQAVRGEEVHVICSGAFTIQATHVLDTLRSRPMRVLKVGPWEVIMLAHRADEPPLVDLVHVERKDGDRRIEYHSEYDRDEPWELVVVTF